MPFVIGKAVKCFHRDITSWQMEIKPQLKKPNDNGIILTSNVISKIFLRKRAYNVYTCLFQILEGESIDIPNTFYVKSRQKIIQFLDE